MNWSYQEHKSRVNQWLDLATGTLKREDLLRLFDLASKTLWKSSKSILSEVTIIAIFDRVQFISSEGFPFLSLLKTDEQGIHFEGLFNKISNISENDLIEGFRKFFTEFLAITGSVTGNVLSPTLHEDFSQVKYIPPVKLLKNITENDGEPQ